MTIPVHTYSMINNRRMCIHVHVYSLKKIIITSLLTLCVKYYNIFLEIDLRLNISVVRGICDGSGTAKM